MLKLDRVDSIHIEGSGLLRRIRRLSNPSGMMANNPIAPGSGTLATKSVGTAISPNGPAPDCSEID